MPAAQAPQVKAQIQGPAPIQPGQVAPVQAAAPVQTQPIQSTATPSNPNVTAASPASSTGAATPGNQIFTPMSAQSAQEAYENTLLTKQGLANTAANAALAQTEAGANLGQGARNTMNESNARNQETTNNQLANQLSQQNVSNLSTFQSLDQNAINNLQSQIQANVPFSALSAQIKQMNPGMTDAQAQQYYSSVQAGKVTIDPATRITNMITGGDTASQINNDPTLRTAVTQQLTSANNGQAPTADQVSAEIQTLYNSTLKTEAGTAATDMTSRLGNISQNATANNIPDATALQDALGDKNIRQDAATYMGVDNTAANKDVIDSYITSTFNTLNQSPVQTAINAVMKSGVIPQQYQGMEDTTEFQSDLRAAIQIMIGNGAMNGQGQLTGKGGAVDFPWSSPGTYFDFNDFSNNAVSGGASSNANANIMIGGNVAKDNNGAPVTNTQALTAWKTVSSADQGSFFNTDGSFNTSKFFSQFLCVKLYERPERK